MTSYWYRKSTSLPAFSLVMAPYGAARRCADRLPIRLKYMQITDKNSSGDEIANVNFLRRYRTYVLQNTKKREPTSFNKLDDS